MKLTVFILIVYFYSCNAARILGIIPLPAYSHQIPYQPIFKELSLRGHQVTVLTTNPQNNPSLTNLTEIDMSSTYHLLAGLNFPDLMNKSYFAFAKVRMDLYTMVTEHMFTIPKVKKIIQDKSEHFDLVMVEIYNPVVYAFAHRFNCPFIGMASADIYNRYYKLTGNPSHPVLYPDVVSMTGNLSFWERFMIVVVDVFEHIMHDYVIYPEQHRLAEKHFGKGLPKLEEIENSKMALMYVNTDLILQTRRPLLPNVVRIGSGLHIKSPAPLPLELQTLLDKATQGVIYFSLGSTVKSKDMSDKTKKIILGTLSELPYQVLWKFETDELLELPENVITSKWFPQQDVLRHPNVVVFITQGGLQSIEEAVHSFVPMVIIPFIGDQPRNARISVDQGMGLALDYLSLTKKAFKDAILEVIKNPKYRNRVKKVSQLMRDDPMTGLEKAIWWAEYVIRHKGAPHLKSKEIPFYQYYLLDVIGFCLAVVVATVYILVKTLRLAVQIVRKTFKQKTKIQ